MSKALDCYIYSIITNGAEAWSLSENLKKYQGIRNVVFEEVSKDSLIEKKTNVEYQSEAYKKPSNRESFVVTGG